MNAGYPTSPKPRPHPQPKPRPKSFLLLCSLLAFVSGCATQMQQPFAGMSAEQISAAVKDKDAAATCITTGQTPWGQGRAVWVNVDANVVKNGGFSITPECGISFTNSPMSIPGTVTTITVPK